MWILGTSLFLGACDDAEKAQPTKPQESSPAPVATPSKPKKKTVPADIKNFLAWVDKAGAAIVEGPKSGEKHAVLGQVSCQKDKEAPDFGYCGSSTDDDPHYAAQWLEKEPKLWATHMILNTASTWVDCKLVGKPSLSQSDKSNVISHRCKYSDGEDLWLRHFVPPGGSHNTQVWVFERDFPKEDKQALHAPRATLQQKLSE